MFCCVDPVGRLGAEHKVIFDGPDDVDEGPADARHKHSAQLGQIGPWTHKRARSAGQTSTPSSGCQEVMSSHSSPADWSSVASRALTHKFYFSPYSYNKPCEGKMNEADVVFDRGLTHFQTTPSPAPRQRRRLTQLCLDDLAGRFVHLRRQGVLICNDSVTGRGPLE